MSRETYLESLLSTGWTADLGQRRGLGDFLYLMTIVRALTDAAVIVSGHPVELIYTGPYARLVDRSVLNLETRAADEGHMISTRHDSPGNPIVAHLMRSLDWPGPKPKLLPDVHPILPTWLDDIGDGTVEVHSSLAMRHYLDLEQRLGIRLPEECAPAPRYLAMSSATPNHISFVLTTATPDKDYGLTAYANVAKRLLEVSNADLHFTVITPRGGKDPAESFRTLPYEWASSAGLVDCLEIFATSELVIGNDTGLTQLAALTQRQDGSSPHVVGLYGKYNFAKWTTGAEWHHAAATPFAQMMMFGDGDIYADMIDASTWGALSDVTSIPPADLAQFAAEQSAISSRW